MSCSNEVYAVPLTVTAQAWRWNRSAFLPAVIAIIEAFQEALDMRRAAQKTYLLNDE